MYVIKRNGQKELVDFQKVLTRIQRLCQELNLTKVDAFEIAKITINAIHDNITTAELDIFAAEKCAERISDHPEYNKLAAGLCVSNLQKMTGKDFLTITKKLRENYDNLGQRNPLVTEEYLALVEKHIVAIQSSLHYERDYLFDYFGFKTLERSYLLRIKDSSDFLTDEKRREAITSKHFGQIVECPQHMIMRVAIGVHGDDISAILETYDLMSQRFYIHATPTLFNAGSAHPQLASCFLLGMEDSIDGIFETIGDIAKISKWAGGVGVHVTDIRASNSVIRGTNGMSNGIIPMIKVLNEVARYVDQGGRRRGAVAVYLEPWHADIMDFCDLRKQQGQEDLRARDIFLALWVPDIFMQRVKDEGVWSLMCPNECPGLSVAYGTEFTALYEKYEAEGRYKRQIKAIELWNHIISAQIETGMPYMLYKDAVNNKSNQKNIGTIQSSNLCCEITEYSDAKQISVCNLASICLPAFLEKTDGQWVYNFLKLKNVAKVAVRGLNKVIDRTYYSLEKSQKTNYRDRPIGLGIQGLADVYLQLEYPFDSPEALLMNKQIFETIYFGALEASVELAIEHGPYESFSGSPFSEGLLQWHHWGLTSEDLAKNWQGGSPWDWQSLIAKVKTHGTRNSLLTSLMPTATTSQIMGYNECFEPLTSNLYKRTTLTGEYVVSNPILVDKLMALGLWNKSLREELLYYKGSVQNIKEVPDNLKKVFRTAFEMKMRPVIQQAIERGPFIDQSQSMNLFMNTPDSAQLTSAHFYGWAHGIKTGMYYLRSRPAADALQFGLDSEVIKRIENKNKVVERRLSPVATPETEAAVATNKKPTRGVCNEHFCEMCSS